jgi:hypothetical protein
VLDEGENSTSCTGNFIPGEGMFGPDVCLYIKHFIDRVDGLYSEGTGFESLSGTAYLEK